MGYVQGVGTGNSSALFSALGWQPHDTMCSVEKSLLISLFVHSHSSHFTYIIQWFHIYAHICFRKIETIATHCQLFPDCIMSMFTSWYSM